jgi:hypothetical protein
MSCGFQSLTRDATLYVPRPKNRSRGAATQVTRALPLKLNRPFHIKGNAYIMWYDVVIFPHFL